MVHKGRKIEYKKVSQKTWNEAPKGYKGKIGNIKYMLLMEKGATVYAPVKIIKKSNLK